MSAAAHGAEDAGRRAAALAPGAVAAENPSGRAWDSAQRESAAHGPPTSSSPACGGANGVKAQRSGLRSTSGVPSRAIKTPHEDGGTLDADERRERRAVGLPASRARAEQGPARHAVVSRALAHEVAPRSGRASRALRRPRIGRRAVEPRRKRLVQFEAAQRAVDAALPRTGEPVRPGGVRTRPMKISPASVAGGRSTATSPARISFSRTMRRCLPPETDPSPFEVTRDHLRVDALEACEIVEASGVRRSGAWFGPRARTRRRDNGRR